MQLFDNDMECILQWSMMNFREIHMARGQQQERVGLSPVHSL